MRSMLACLCLVVTGLFSVIANATTGIWGNGYKIYSGDVDGDGLDDLYFEYHRPVIILHGDVATPITMAQLPNFVLYGTADGASLSYGPPLEITLDESVIIGLKQLDSAASMVGDFNGDGDSDLFVHSTVPLILHANDNNLPALAQTFPIGSDTTEIAVLLSSADPEKIAIKDSNGDGKDDIVITGVTTLLAGASGTFDSHDSPIVPSTPNLAGASGGQFRVNESGAATYFIPIATAAGTAGVVPEVSLNYSGNAGNGLVGQGWSIGGLSGISRCRQILGIDGTVAPINWSESDRFCLDGQRLLVVDGGAYGSVDATYKTEIDSFAKIMSVGGSLGKPAYFRVEKKDGSSVFYGNSAGSKLQLGSNTLSWMQNRFEDSVGNHIEYQYEGDVTSGHRIKEIRYAYGSDSYSAEVEFTYEARPDTISSYTAGHEVKIIKRLKKITSRSNGIPIREYSLGYRPVPSGQYPDKTSLLANVQECVGSSSCLPEISFDWLRPSISYPASGIETIDFSYSDRYLRKFEFGDFNGDGKQDIVWIEGDEDGGYTRIKYATSNGTLYAKRSFSGSKFREHYYTEVDAVGDLDLRVLDYNGDGRHDIAIYNKKAAYGALSGRWTIFLSRYDGARWSLDSNPIYTDFSDSDALFADFNTDGLVDYISIGGSQVKVHFLEKYGASASSDNFYKFSSNAQTFGFPYNSGNGTVPATFGDFNGDGAMDFLVEKWTKEYACFREPGGYDPRCGPDYTWIAVDSSFDGYSVVALNPDTGNFESMALLHGSSKLDPVAVDINGDGLTDLAIYSSGGGHNPVGEIGSMTIWLSTGTGFVKTGSGSDPEGAGFSDINNDGYQDLFWPDFDSGYVKVRHFDPNANRFPEVAHNWKYLSTDDRDSAWFSDVNGDGQIDYHSYDHSSGKMYTYLANAQDINNRNKPRNLISKIDNGLGNITEITYSNMVRSDVYSRIEMSVSTGEEECFTEPNEPNGNGGYIEGGTYCYSLTTGDPATLYEALNGPWDLPNSSHTIGKDKPVLEVLTPVFLVSKVESSAPEAGINPGSVNHSAESSVSYHYHQMKLQAAGRGMLGFQKITSIDNQTGVATETVYRQDFPFTGMPLQTETYTASGKLLSKAANSWRLKGWDGSGKPAAPYKPYIYKSIEEIHDLAGNGAEQGGLLQTVVTENAYDSYGNALSIKITTTDATTDDQYVKNTVNTYGSSTWEKEKGRLSNTKVTNTRPGMTNHMRESAFTYYTSGTLKGLLKTAVIEPNKPAYTQTTLYEYDQFGNVSKKTLSASGEVSRSTRTVYDLSGRYATGTYNALGHLMERVVLRNHFGAPLIVGGLNGLRSYFAYDAMGREVYSWNNAGADKLTEYGRCTSGCPAGAKYRVTSSSKAGAWKREYYDALGRVMRTETQGFSGVIYKDREYDEVGRTRFVSEPYFSGGARLWAETEYDLLGRPSRILAPDQSESTIDYEGLKTITTNDKGRAKTEIRSVAGELVEVINAIDGRLTYEYDNQGNLHKAKSWGTGSTPITVSINYDHLGRKTSMNDPDKGSWSYVYNKYGELKKQTNANGHTVEFTYDKLGRQKNRIDRENGTSIKSNVTWYYDSAANGLGQVEMIGDSVNGYEAVYQYDSLGRNDTQLVDFDGEGLQPAYVSTSVFDSYGRVARTYDALDSVLTTGRSGTRNHFNSNGYLYKVTDLATGDLIYQVKKQTARGQLEEQLLGNGATTTYDYQASTGRLLNQTSTVLGSFGIQNITYQWDTLGNLTSRHNQSGSKNLRESFCYDDLNRLIKTHIGASNYNCAGLTASGQDVKYNAIGNITYKAGVGNYTYGQNGAGPHAVTTAGSATYRYDANGNMTSDTFDGGRTISYSTFDKALTISKGNHTTEFLYGPGRERYYRKDSAGGDVTETWYIGNVERIQKSTAPNQIQWKRHLAGIAVYTVATDLSYSVESTDKIFLYKDHLGSMDLLTDENGTVKQEMSFDAWGQRRSALNWSGLTLPALYSFNHSRTTRGYTGHEMLDEVGLINMNGRVYDPRLGRFMQADPFVQAASDTQMHNRYSYVRNNPLNATDPSGYFLDKLFKGLNKLLGDFAPFAGIALGIMLGPGGWLALGEGIGAAMTAGFIAGGVASGSLKGAFTGALSAAVFYGIGEHFQGISETNGMLNRLGANLDLMENGLTAAEFTQKVMLHALAGGVMSVINGGKFGHGFAAAGVVQAASTKIDGIGGKTASVKRVTAAAVVGGTVSKMTGGKFANGAVTGAFSRAFNDEFQDHFKQPKPLTFDDIFDADIGLGVSSGGVSLDTEGGAPSIDLNALGEMMIPVSIDGSQIKLGKSLGLKNRAEIEAFGVLRTDGAIGAGGQMNFGGATVEVQATANAFKVYEWFLKAIPAAVVRSVETVDVRGE